MRYYNVKAVLCNAMWYPHHSRVSVESQGQPF